MKNNYKFISEIEPTDEQLHLIMHEVAIEAKNKAKIAKIKFNEKITLEILNVQARMKVKSI
jgi:hypothetical protein